MHTKISLMKLACSVQGGDCDLFRPAVLKVQRLRMHGGGC